MSDRCDQDVYNNGTQVFLTNTISSANMEVWVQKIASDSGQKVDWHFYAGRARVLALGDIPKVIESIKSNKKMHDDFYAEAFSTYLPDQESKRFIDGIWDYNGL